MEHTSDSAPAPDSTPGLAIELSRKEFTELKRIAMRYVEVLRFANGLAPFPERLRPLVLKLNNMFARWIDHSRVGVLEVQGNTKEWQEIGWETLFGWKMVFEGAALHVFDTELGPGQDFALNLATPRRTCRQLNESEQAVAALMQKEEEKARGLLKGLAPPEQTSPQ